MSDRGTQFHLDLLAPRTWLLLRSLLTTRTDPRPLAPTLALTVALLDELESEGVIEVHWRITAPCPTADCPKSLRWRLTPHMESIPRLADALAMRLSVLARTQTLRPVCLPLWDALVEAEATAYLARRLRRAGGMPEDARDLADIAANLRAPVSIAQWRTCIRVAVKHGSAGRSPDAPAAYRHALYEALRRQVELSRSPQPRPRRERRAVVPATAVARVLATLLPSEGDYFWTAPDAVPDPSRETK